MQNPQLSRVVQDVIAALTTLGGYTTIGTAGAADGSITAIVAHIDPDGDEHIIEVRVSQSA